MNKTAKLLLVNCFVLLLCITALPLMAQDPGGGPDAPIDGGLSLLLVAAAAYGIKLYRKNRLEKQV